MAHTCFNQLVLPDYGERGLLARKMATALDVGLQGFGIM